MKNTRARIFGVLSAVGAMMLAYGCATNPEEMDSVQNARSAYQQASKNDEINRYASVSLYEAQQSLQRMNKAIDEGADAEEIDHLAYLVQQRVEISKARAQQRLAADNIDQLGKERAQLQLDMRLAETQQARERADQAQQRTTQLEEELKRIQAGEVRQEERGTVLSLGDVFFDFGTSQIKGGSNRTLDKLAQFLNNNPQHNVVIEGYTDSVGSAQTNQQLSQQRARAVVDYLTGKGISRDRLVAQGYGESFPVASNDSDAGRQLNRRVEIVVLRDGQPAASARRDQQPGATEEAASFSELDRNRDGYLTQDETRQIQSLSNNFQQYDQDRDQQLSRSEFAAYEQSETQQSGQGSQPGQQER